MKVKKVIVTGGSGFIGSHLVDALVDAGIQVTVIDKKKPRKSLKNLHARYRLFDIQSEDAFEVIRKVKPDVVFHLAAHIHDRESVREPIMNAEHNLIGTLNILEALRAVKNGRMIFASTGGVIYGNQKDLPCSEETIPVPETPYAISKLTAERYMNFYHQVLNIPYVALRFANVYGPRQDSSAESGAIGIFASALLRGEQAFINNDGETTRDYVYVSDAVDAFMKALESDYVGVVNIGTGKETSTKELYELVASSVGTQTPPEYREEVLDVVKHSVLDAKRAKKELGWTATTSLETGIEETVNWYRENI